MPDGRAVSAKLRSGPAATRLRFGSSGRAFGWERRSRGASARLDSDRGEENAADPAREAGRSSSSRTQAHRRIRFGGRFRDQRNQMPMAAAAKTTASESASEAMPEAGCRDEESRLQGRGRGR